MSLAIKVSSVYYVDFVNNHKPLLYIADFFSLVTVDVLVIADFIFMNRKHRLSDSNPAVLELRDTRVCQAFIRHSAMLTEFQHWSSKTDRDLF